MVDKKRRRPFGFFGFDEEFGFGEEFERMREEMEEIMERMMRGLPDEEVRRLSERRGPQVYGFSVRVGPDGKPVVTEFGNVGRAPVKEEQLETRTREPETEEREPLVDVFKDKKGVNVIAEMPGVGEKEVQLSVKGRELEIRAEGARKYYRKVELPEDVSTKKMERKYRNGVLELVFS
ncbi:MAG: archaeal heat shock protein Hsp20 [Candidatus Micrarchaeota archaeon]